MNKALGTAAIGGGVGGLLDILYAITLWGFILGGSPVGILQSIASGILGKAAYDGGAATAILGLALHFFIAFSMALVYVLAARHLRVLTARPLLMGALYGVLLFAVMNFVVVPLSAIGPRPMTPIGAFRALLPHVIFVGPVIAWFAARRAPAPAAPVAVPA
ncbi:MAG TPA: hypothetical protein VMF52_11735 [Steroidobacteraceae bacterium]|nr:hypothetical protein [Steroidobacteraceae bacterium]